MAQCTDMADGLCSEHEVIAPSDTTSCWKNSKGDEAFAVPLNICRFILKNDDGNQLLAGTSDITGAK